MQSCSHEQDIRSYTVSYNFTDLDQGWVGDFASYPEDSAGYHLNFKHDTLPSNLNAGATKKALRISGNNKNDELFMFIKKKISGLRPNTPYQILFNVRLASDAPSGEVEAGVAPGDSVHLKAGATTVEPITQLTGSVYDLNIDEGEQSEDGEDMIVIGNVAVASTTTVFTMIVRNNNSSNGFFATTDANGELWLILGTDSDYEGTTTLYYTQIDVLFNQSD